jgi:hypothetical protein
MWGALRTNTRLHLEKLSASDFSHILEARSSNGGGRSTPVLPGVVQKKRI